MPKGSPWMALRRFPRVTLWLEARQTSHFPDLVRRTGQARSGGRSLDRTGRGKPARAEETWGMAPRSGQCSIQTDERPMIHEGKDFNLQHSMITWRRDAARLMNPRTPDDGKRVRATRNPTDSQKTSSVYCWPTLEQALRIGIGHGADATEDNNHKTGSRKFQQRFTSHQSPPWHTNQKAV